MNAKQLLQAGELTKALEALQGEIREHPMDLQRRTFLFELLCFNGEYQRAEETLAAISGAGPSSLTGALLYRGALAAEMSRQKFFENREYAGFVRGASRGIHGICNGISFHSIADTDPRVGACVETFAHGEYLRIPFEDIVSIAMPAPRRLRDLLWAPAVIRPGPALRSLELGEVLMPALAPFSWKYPDDAVRLGRRTVWETSGDGEEVPFGLKVLMVDSHELPFLELRNLEILEIPPAGSSAPEMVN